MIRLYKSNVLGVSSNTRYANLVEVNDKASLIEAVKNDYVCAEYKGGYRSDDNFIKSNCLPFDVDNDTTDDTSKWLTPDKVKSLFPGVTFAVHYSRNHMKNKTYVDKNGVVTRVVTARPRFHIFFEIDELDDAEAYKNLKMYISVNYPYFDKGAMDAARFFFGTKDPEVDYFEGELTLSQFLDEEEFDKELNNKVIKEGSRNTTMSFYAGKVLVRLGNTDAAYKLFIKKSLTCKPLLEDEELNQIWNSALRFYEKVSKSEGYISPEDYKKTYGLMPRDYSDIGEARAFIYGYGAELIYTEPTGYLFYNGEYWEESIQLPVAEIENFLDEQLEDANNKIAEAISELEAKGVNEDVLKLTPKKMMEIIVDCDAIEEHEKYANADIYKKYVMKTRNLKNFNNALTAAIPMVLHNVNELDRHPYLLNCPTCVVDLRTGEQLSKSRDYFFTKQTLVDPSDKGKEIWMDALNTFFKCDIELIDYVQKVVGLAAIGKVLSEMLVIAYGDGRNGKSTFWNTIAKVLGTYSGAISASILTIGNKSNAKPELAELKGKRIIIAAELEEGTRMNTSIVKQLSSTDSIRGEKKFKQPFDFVPSHLTVLYTNHLPRVGALDSGTWRRLKIIPFNAKIEGDSDIKNYTDYLLENASQYILKWIIEGAIKANKDGGKIKEASVVKEAIDKYRGKNNWLQTFIDEVCELGPTMKCRSGQLYTEYRNYCARNGEFTRSTTDFYTEIENLGLERKKTRDGYMVRGISIKDTTDF